MNENCYDPVYQNALETIRKSKRCKRIYQNNIIGATGPTGPTGPTGSTGPTYPILGESKNN